VKKRFGVLHSKYGNKGVENLARAFANLLVTGDARPYTDLVGEVYMQLSLGNVRAGQYFTPESVTIMMAEMMIPDGGKEVQDRIKQALCHPDNHLGAAVLFAGSVVSKDQMQRYFIERIIPVAVPFYEPIRVMDPAVGSGRTLLAAAAQYPRWTIANGLVQFWGMDIDPLCVAMCELNVKLYGLNGRGVHVFDLEDAMILQLPSPYSEAYLLAKEAKNAGREDITEAIALDLRVEQQAFDLGKYQQLELFQAVE